MRSACLLLLFSSYCFISFAQNPLLLAQATGGNNNVKVEKIIATSSGNAFYNVTDYANPFSANWGLWTTNGTRESTKKLLLQDVRFITTEATLLTPFDSSRVLFAGDNSDGYGEVWVSDGTPAGTFGLQNFLPGAGGTPVRAIGAIGNLGIYAAALGDGMLRLHATHGNAYGDTAVFYTFPAAITSALYFTTINNVLYFLAQNDITHDNEIWRTNGTTSGTYLLKDLTANGLTSDFMSFNGNIYFVTISSTLGDYIWKSDGTPAGTAPLKQLATSFQPDNIYPSYTATSSALYFAASDGVHGKEVWTTDGTNTGTHMVTDLFAGSTGSNPSSFVTLRDTLYLSANNGITGQELYRYNGSSVALIKDIYPGGTGSNPSSLAVNNNSIVFSAKQNETDGAELWVSGGTANTTFEMENITKSSATSSSPSLITPGAKNFFTGTYDVDGDGLAIEPCVFLYTPPNKIWTGNVSTNASVADNWFPPGAPSGTDDIIIPASATPNSMTNPFLFPHSFYNNGGIVNADNGLVLISGDFYNEGTINADVNTSVFGVVSTGDGATHFVGSPGTYNGKLIFSGGLNVKFSTDTKVTVLRNEGATSIRLGDYNLTADRFDVFTPRIITDGNGKLFLPVGASNVLFPVTTDSLSYTPVTISNAGVYDYFGVNVKNGVLTNGYSGDTLTGQAVNKTWDVTEQSAGGSHASLTFQWSATDELSPFDRNLIYAAHYTSSTWDNGSLLSASGTDPFTVTRSNITSFSPFAVFSSSSVLPVTFAGIAAKLSAEDVIVSWQASNDNSTRYYNIQRSFDGKTFTTIGQQQRMGGDGLHSYTYTDIKAASLSAAALCYRLQLVTGNGNADVSQTVSVKLPARSSSFRVWPSPVSDVLHVILNNGAAQGNAVIYDASGKLVMISSVKNNSQTNITVSALPAGEYFIKVYTDKGAVSSRFMKK